MGSGDCCNYYENDTCVARCPVGQEPDSSYDCGMYIIICTNFSVSLGANEAPYLLFYTIDREILTRKSIRLLNFHLPVVSMQKSVTDK